MVLFERCCDAVMGSSPLIRLPDGGVALDHVSVTRAVLTSVLEETSCRRTRDEIDRILADAPATSPYVA